MAKSNLDFTGTGDLSKAVKELEKTQKRVEALEDRLKKFGNTSKTSGKEAEGAFGGATKQLGSMLTGLAGPAGITAALAAVSKAYGVWKKDIRDVGKEAKQAADQIIAFAALQEGGTKAQRVKQAARLGAKFGIADQAVAFGAIQSIQSGIEASTPGISQADAFELALKEARTVFQATRLDITLEDSTEAAIQALAQKQTAGSFVRKAFVAGQASARDPAVLAKAAPSLQFFKDKDLGFAVAGVLAGSYKDQLATFVKGGGVALSGVSALNKEFKGEESLFSRLGLAEDATQIQRLEALAKGGFDTPEKLAKAGLTELVRAQAVANLVSNFEAVKSIQKQVTEKAVPGILFENRAEVEREIPATKLAREIDELKAQRANVRAFGEQSVPALQIEKSERQRALFLERGGQRVAFGVYPLIDEEGRAPPASIAIAAADRAARLTIPGVQLLLETFEMLFNIDTGPFAVTARRMEESVAEIPAAVRKGIEASGPSAASRILGGTEDGGRRP